jgi:hypothetical protein
LSFTDASSAVASERFNIWDDGKISLKDAPERGFVVKGELGGEDIATMGETDYTSWIKVELDLTPPYPVARWDDFFLNPQVDDCPVSSCQLKDRGCSAAYTGTKLQIDSNT